MTRRRLPLRTALVAVLTLSGLTLAAQGLWIPAKAALAQVLLDRAFARTLSEGRPEKAWGWADTWPVARISVPRLGRSAVALSGVSGEALAFGPGWAPGTPEAGDDGVAVYAAHRDTHFAFLADLVVGDVIEVTRRDGRRARYRMTGARVASWDRSGIDPNAAGRGLALATCWPFGARTSGPLRYVVEATAVEDAPVTASAERRP
ncbi:class GN sortase [Methylopila sp. 73B]|uniref:class GN sortase n=1 Tax=Methylopila sp. 73B TaxID=1120792 RepID=UPI00036DFF7C|nr:class GN sortase [Methylopila sp. 73B]